MMKSVRSVLLSLLRLRYDIRVHNLDAIKARGTKGILFLPTHPALIDPVIVTTWLMDDFSARPFADMNAIDLPGIGWFARKIGTFAIPTVARYGKEATEKIEATLQESIQALRNGDNVILYPAGGTLRSRNEVVRGTSAVETILRELPDVRVVLVRTRGLWGSSFSLQSGRDPDVAKILERGVGQLLASGVFFAPRRRVDITFDEPADFPRVADRTVVNPWLEAWYNVDAPPATYVPYTIWERGMVREIADPDWGGGRADANEVPPATRQIVESKLKELSGATTLHDSDLLAQNLGMDSLVRADLMVWLEAEFGFPQGNTDSLRTVADVLLAATGEAMGRSDDWVHPPAAHWFKAGNDQKLRVPPGAKNIAEAFLAQAARAPGGAIVADVNSGVKTWNDLITGVLALRPAVQALPGERIGIMMPATVAACLSYLTVVFAGRTPVMYNWTVGRRNMLHGIELTGTEKILTVKPLVTKLRQQGLDLTGVEERFVYLEDLGAALGKADKVKAALQARLWWGSLRGAKVSEVAAILFTSGSESLPKAVPLTHANILTQLHDVMKMVESVVSGRDRLLAMLPPFHSFGLSGNMVLSLTTGLPAVFHANPTEGPILAQTLDAYKATVALATPTFLGGMLRAANKEQAASLRLAVTGAEECPPRLYELVADRCPHALVLEGYGITECSPVVAVNIPEDPRPNTIGRLLASLEHVVLGVESDQPVGDEEQGMLLLHGPTIFPGYMGDAPDPFVEHAGKRWYRTGDLVTRSADGVFTFRGRLKRFVKLGGEMISLPAVESVLQKAFPLSADGPAVAVVATAGERPELVLYAIGDIDRERANGALRDAGLSALHNIRRVERVEAIPLLGTGKTDYRTLQTWLDKGGEPELTTA